MSRTLDGIKPEHSGTSWSLYVGDSTKLLEHFPDGSVDYFVTSPPYNLGISSGGGFPTKRTGKWGGGKLVDGYSGHSDAMPPEEYRRWQANFLSLAWKKLSDTGAIFYNHKPRIQRGKLETPLDWNPGLPVRQIVIWKRSGGINFSPSFYLPVHEWIVIFAKDGFRLKSKGASGVGDVWEIAQETQKTVKHPAPFPFALPNRILSTVASGGKLVVDPYCGSGTTCLAAIANGFEFIGIELSPEYVNEAATRIRQFERNRAMDVMSCQKQTKNKKSGNGSSLS